MTPITLITVEQALDTLDKAVATVTTNREGHDILKRCVAVLREAIQKGQPEATSLTTMEAPGVKDSQE